MSRRLDIVVPVLNEEQCIEEFYARVRALGLSDALIFVDNASNDRTVELIEQLPDVRLVRHTRNEGYGASILDGIAASDGERIVIIDVDMEYPPEALPALLEALEHNPCVYASRFLTSAPAGMPLLRRIGNRIVTGLFNLLFDQSTTDLYTGMKALRRDAFALEALRRRGFEHVIELSVLVAQAGRQIHDVPIVYTPRSRGVSKMRHVPEALKFVAFTVWYWLRPTRPTTVDTPRP